ncbi:unnamed protein product [Adineta ricciae]|uniref:Uncharacterized protein n=1 Tax=Adineta ricciae TaxID=249248 RepID=A0A813S708_ADIRI|nr:unnamed protein product [Adineta ricciae]
MNKKREEAFSDLLATLSKMVSTLILVIIALFVPPLAVYLHENSCNNVTILNLILTILFFLPGLIHALWVILK